MTWEPFARIFAGFDGAYGTYQTTSEPGQNGKLEMIGAVTRRGAVTAEMWERHLGGSHPLAIIPIDREQRARWGAIDIDLYGIDHLELIRKIRALNLPLVVCKSKSGGAHAYLFLKRADSASAVRAQLAEWGEMLGYARTEVFPKQAQVDWDAGDLGSHLNLPYFGGSRTKRYAYDDEGKALTLDGFIRVVEERATTLQGISEEAREARRLRQAAPSANPEDDGPPCLQALYRDGFPEGSRHDGLFAIGTWAKKAFPERWEEVLDQYHERYFHPPKPGDLTDVKRSLSKKDYGYKCKQPPIVSHCNRTLCMQRRHGVCSREGVPYPDLTKVASEPPIYFLSIGNEHRVRLTSGQLMAYPLVRKKALEVMNQMPPMMKPLAWEQILSDLLEVVTVVPSLAPSEEALARQAFMDYVRRGRRRVNGAEVNFQAAAWSPLIDGRTIYLNWSRFVADYQKRARTSHGVLVALATMLRVEATEHPQVQKITLDEDVAS